jgi:cyclopropane fatty-acyl-phospholipid synthase-like methyltransferase
VKQSSPAALRNRDAIADELASVLPREGLVLEIASGSGEHVVHFAERFPALTFQPSDPREEARASIDDYARELGARVLPALALDVTAPWPIGHADAVVCINMLHASVPETLPSLMRGAATILAKGAPLVTYGAYKIGGAHTAPSNETFDAWLKERDPRWGVRDLEAVVLEAERAGFALEKRVAMPANNFTLVFRRT